MQDPIVGEKYVMRVDYVKNTHDYGDPNRFYYTKTPAPPVLMKASASKLRTNVLDRQQRLHNVEQIKLDTNKIYVDQFGNQYLCQDVDDFNSQLAN